MNKNQKIAIALLAGIAAGTVAALLLAPEEGKNTRNKLANITNDLIKKLKTEKNSHRDSNDNEETTLGI